jgi:hypothetical protein
MRRVCNLVQEKLRALPSLQKFASCGQRMAHPDWGKVGRALTVSGVQWGLGTRPIQGHVDTSLPKMVLVSGLRSERIGTRY